MRCGVVPVFFESFALLGENRRALDGQGSGGVILRRVDVATRPANFRSERLCNVSTKDGCLDRHAQAAGRCAAPLSGLLAEYFLRMAMRPGISCSAMAISLRPQSAKTPGQLTTKS